MYHCIKSIIDSLFAIEIAGPVFLFIFK